MSLKQISGELIVISLPCSGKVDIPYLVKAFETGADGVVIITCEENECHNIEGNMRAQRRAHAVDSLLEEIGMGVGRIKVIQAKLGGRQVAGEIKSLCEQIKKMPQFGVVEQSV